MVWEQLLRNIVLDHFKFSAHFSPTPVWAGPLSRFISLYKARQIPHTVLLFGILMPIVTFLVGFPQRFQLFLLNSTLGFYVIQCPALTHTHFDFPYLTVSSSTSKPAI